VKSLPAVALVAVLGVCLPGAGGVLAEGSEPAGGVVSVNGSAPPGLPAGIDPGEGRGVSSVVVGERDRTAMLVEAVRREGFTERPEVREALDRMVARLYERHHLGKQLRDVTVGDDEIETYYREHRDEFSRPGAFRTAAVRISVSATATAEERQRARNRAETLRKEARRLSSDTFGFGPLAVRYSDDQATRYRGGDQGWIVPGEGHARLPETVRRAAESLAAVGEVSDVIETDGVLYVLRLIDRRSSEVRPLAAVRETIRARLLKEKQVEIRRRFYADVEARLSGRTDGRAFFGVRGEEQTSESENQ